MSAPTSSAVAHEPRESYDGPATLLDPDSPDVAPLELEVRLRGHFQPIDGLFHWWGRVAADDSLDDSRSGSTITVRTEYGEAAGRLSDRDPWGRFRVVGTGRPPF